MGVFFTSVINSTYLFLILPPLRGLREFATVVIWFFGGVGSLSRFRGAQKKRQRETKHRYTTRVGKQRGWAMIATRWALCILTLNLLGASEATVEFPIGDVFIRPTPTTAPRPSFAIARAGLSAIRAFQNTAATTHLVRFRPQARPWPRRRGSFLSALPSVRREHRTRFAKDPTWGRRFSAWLLARAPLLSYRTTEAHEETLPTEGSKTWRYGPTHFHPIRTGGGPSRGDSQEGRSDFTPMTAIPWRRTRGASGIARRLPH